MAGHVKDLTGQKFGRLTVIEQHGFGKPNKNGSRYSRWLCLCECGNYCERDSGELKKRYNHSCGCLGKEHLKEMCKNNITHGMTDTRVYNCYKAMMRRCYNEKDPHYNAYGRRGIIVCEDWKGNPKAFIEWALKNGYSDDLTIERIDVDGNYEPENCTWIPMKDQYKNKQATKRKLKEGEGDG